MTNPLSLNSSQHPNFLWGECSYNGLLLRFSVEIAHPFASVRFVVFIYIVFARTVSYMSRFPP